MSVFWFLLIGHFVADYPLQTDFIARGKSRKADPQYVPWYYVLTSHAMTHAAAVGIITGSLWLSVFEAVAHWFIDLAKCEGWTGIHTDQALHVLCKLAWVGLIAWGVA